MFQGVQVRRRPSRKVRDMSYTKAQQDTQAEGRGGHYMQGGPEHKAAGGGLWQAGEGAAGRSSQLKQCFHAVETQLE